MTQPLDRHSERDEFDHGPFDPAELVRWAETYGHPEVWVKKAQQAHARAERVEAERDRCIEQVQRLYRIICNERDPDYLGSLAFQLREALNG